MTGWVDQHIFKMAVHNWAMRLFDIDVFDRARFLRVTTTALGLVAWETCFATEAWARLLVLFEEEVDIVLKSFVVHEGAQLEKRLPVDGLWAITLKSLVGASWVAQVSRDKSWLAGGNLKLAVRTLHWASRLSLQYHVVVVYQVVEGVWALEPLVIVFKVVKHL